MARFTEDFMEKIVDVSWEPGLWLGVYVNGSTNNNSVACSYTASGVVGGNPLDVLTGFIAPHKIVSNPDLRSDEFGIWLHFTQSLADAYLDSLFGVHYFNVRKLLSTLGPGVPITGSIALSNVGNTNSSAFAFFAKTKGIKNRTVSFTVPSPDGPAPVFGLPTVADHVGTFKFLNVPTGTGGTLNFSANVEALTIT